MLPRVCQPRGMAEDQQADVDPPTPEQLETRAAQMRQDAEAEARRRAEEELAATLDETGSDSTGA
jgi:hypothetical protein